MIHHEKVECYGTHGKAKTCLLFENKPLIHKALKHLTNPWR